ncbi:MAG: PHP domain-containing protein [Gemmatimonadaceae bacterium]
MSFGGATQGEARNVDLHSHSTASDGAVSPTDVIVAAERVGIGAIALTDHDTVAGLPEAVAAGARLGVRVVPGCELSAYDGDFEIHLLALHISDGEAIAPSLALFQHERVDRAQAMVDRLVRLGAPVSMDSVLREAAGGAVGRPHVARALLQAGHVVDNREAFDRYLGNGRPAYVPKPRFTVADAIALAHSAGALAVWAHPSREGTRTRVEHLAALGMDGVEVRHPSHSPLDVERLGALVAEFGLVPSGGSDWHGATEGYRTLGNMQVPSAWLAQQDALVAARGVTRLA